MATIGKIVQKADGSNGRWWGNTSNNAWHVMAVSAHKIQKIVRIL